MITPIVWPAIDWWSFTTLSNSTIGRSPTRMLDVEAIEVGSLTSFVKAIGGFMYEKVNLYDFIRTNAIALETLSFTFLCQDNALPLLRVHTDFIILASTESVFLLSGTLGQFKRTIIEQTNLYCNPEVKRFCQELFLVFRSRGLEEVWAGYSHAILLGT